ncbi:hypothetical protein PROFUN_01942 [Planoprotostelium fungivorum]|uniref:Uncharacterized protein n=1 Tax=Planoprotostelium fungivorum TaxID=1890364 RepID=A0A2P6NAY2_9EUKA|nr:hypothetical protein PROFUN_01942 [Planoprotostelium fungivorum]
MNDFTQGVQLVGFAEACDYVSQKADSMAHDRYRETTGNGHAPIRSLDSEEMSSRIDDQLTIDEVRTTQILMEKSLQYYMNQTEVQVALHAQAGIDPAFTALVWRHLEELNPEFFKFYSFHLRMKDQIAAFNHLVSHQAQLMQKSGLFNKLNAPQHALSAAQLSQPGLFASRGVHRPSNEQQIQQIKLMQQAQKGLKTSTATLVRSPPPQPSRPTIPNTGAGRGGAAGAPPQGVVGANRPMAGPPKPIKQAQKATLPPAKKSVGPLQPAQTVSNPSNLPPRPPIKQNVQGAALKQGQPPVKRAVVGPGNPSGAVMGPTGTRPTNTAPVKTASTVVRQTTTTGPSPSVNLVSATAPQPINFAPVSLSTAAMSPSAAYSGFGLSPSSFDSKPLFGTDIPGPLSNPLENFSFPGSTPPLPSSDMDTNLFFET